MHHNTRSAFFDSIAEKWDGWEDLPSLERKFADGLEAFGVCPDETVVDVGCGTGNLTRALLERLSPRGRVVAVDISARMLEVARVKVADGRASWHQADARSLPLADETCERVFCYSVWPHFEDREAVAAELKRVLVRGGALHVWHLISRERINAIHSEAGEAVRSDILPSAEETAHLLAGAGFSVVAATEADGRYVVTATKP
jgi:demethylmenaquinone methyltransferase/2-methoxy-6-polyprenyl-1,4-benzoquinol methylase